MRRLQVTEGTLARKMKQFDSREMFAGWIWIVLQAIHQKIYQSADVILIRRYDSSVEGLARVYETCVPKDRRKIFRQAIGDVLRLKGNNEDAPPGVFEDLIYLIERINATEALGAIAPTVSNGLLGEKNPEIIYSTVSLLSTLSPSSMVYKAICDLRDGVNFDRRYAADVRKILTACKRFAKRSRRK
ncbi:hypothetical protein A2Z63_02125 [Candidatus Giovannonibacteria bacterium RIFCSPLOWO2_02_44_8]|uniref:Uncharacterized protein n=2 Tax=Candidatus Giovannoniibacteriota TaxID=1752738 RepID=A0A1F5XC25_9BACT|nr:MAG: hypothetical protein A2W57_03285 [Candidatus Giovannonibacteria bacterium RIFCSPHIGHO2_02_43_16]OGF85409.1 MAG: hypothetical protein A2Z63_02125 [Candidatus Giovannonibacteria bacterium RIFCSPLOWO2_02_44_8]